MCVSSSLASVWSVGRCLLLMTLTRWLWLRLLTITSRRPFYPMLLQNRIRINLFHTIRSRHVNQTTIFFI
jgi:hypothetical protein